MNSIKKNKTIYSGLTESQLEYLIGINIDLEKTKIMANELLHRYFEMGKTFDIYSILAKGMANSKYICFEEALKYELKYKSIPMPSEHLESFAKLLIDTIDQLKKAMKKNNSDTEMNWSIGRIGELEEIFKSLSKAKISNTNLLNSINSFVLAYNKQKDEIANKDSVLAVIKKPILKEMPIAVSKMNKHELEYAIDSIYDFSPTNQIKIAVAGLKRMPQKIIKRAPEVVFFLNKDLHLEKINMEDVVYRAINGFFPGGYVKQYKQHELDYIKPGCTKFEAMDVICEWLENNVEGYEDDSIKFLRGISLNDLHASGIFSKDNEDFLIFKNSLLKGLAEKVINIKVKSFDELCNLPPIDVDDYWLRYRPRSTNTYLPGKIVYSELRQSFIYERELAKMQSMRPLDIIEHIFKSFIFDFKLPFFKEIHAFLSSLELNEEFIETNIINSSYRSREHLDRMFNDTIKNKIINNAFVGDEKELLTSKYFLSIMKRIDRSEAYGIFVEILLKKQYDFSNKANIKSYFKILLASQYSIDYVENKIYGDEVKIDFHSLVFNVLNTEFKAEYDLVSEIFHYTDLNELKSKIGYVKNNNRYNSTIYDEENVNLSILKDNETLKYFVKTYSKYALNHL